ncbi:GGDEF domain-containing protein [Azohydromonas aeria]|uniref:GGDEF domain-containing protein n=1 Tax=Azohydromonas aeria TaxID=2590212 RepID=UPI0012F995EF|nr:GGDEF domain-containing protein [Azohydromonas aeria]
MTSVIDHLAELTGHRDREHADALLLDALWELLQPLSVALHRGLGEGGGAPWTTVLRRGAAGAPQRGRPAAPAPDWPLAGACAECLREQRIVEAESGGHGAPAVTLLPLQVGAQVLGVAELHTHAPLGAALQRTAQAIARLYGNFLALLDYGQRDALTGLFNRKTFDDSFMRVVLRGVGVPAEGEGEGEGELAAPQRCFLAALDLDHFKRVNDNFGHLIGDEVLMLTARVMRSVLQLDDGLFRFGGEEFVVLLDAPDEAAAHAQLERLRQAVARHDYPQVGRVTLSIGFTEVRAEDLPTTAMERADRALYRAKDSGRDCVVGPAALAAAGLMEVIAHESHVDFF